MSFTLDRRSFLQSLIALGATYALSSKATTQEVQKVWSAALADPWYFDVNDYGTITEPDQPENATQGEVFNIYGASLRTPEDVIDAVCTCHLLGNRFQVLAENELEALVNELDSLDRLSILRRQYIKKVIEALNNDPDEGWIDWVRLEGKAGIERFKKEIIEWEKEPADYSQSEWFPRSFGAQGKAMIFFELLGSKICDDLGVVIVEGEHPGSTYYAAELRNDIVSANETAAELELPLRFKKEGTDPTQQIGLSER